MQIVEEYRRPTDLDLENERILLRTTGRRIRKIRLLRGFSQEKMAFFLEKSRQFVIQIEQGKNHLSLRALIKISLFLRVRIDAWFLNEKEWESFARKIDLDRYGRGGIRGSEIGTNGYDD